MIVKGKDGCMCFVTAISILLVMIILAGLFKKGNGEDLGVCLFLALIVVSIWTIILFLKQREKNRLRKSYQEEELREKILLKKISIESENLKDYVIKNYQIKACNKCNEIEMKLIEVSPNGRSVLYRCEYCKHNMHGNILIGHDAIYPSQKYKDIIDLLSQSATSGTLFNTSVNINFTVASNNERNNAARIKIPEEVRHEVWRRDLGRCVNCGSQNKLEFDHIIPLSKGGSDSARNIQLLCEECNRKKSAKI